LQIGQLRKILTASKNTSTFSIAEGTVIAAMKPPIKISHLSGWLIYLI
jgi:hypothetical protein